MAFTETQKVEIRTWLGWSERFHQENTALEMAMSAVGQIAEAQAKVEEILTKLDSIETAITSALGRLKALKVGSIGLPGEKEIAVLRQEGRRWVGKLADRFGVDVEDDVFSPGRRRGFSSGAGSWGSGGGNVMRF